VTPENIKTKIPNTEIIKYEILKSPIEKNEKAIKKPKKLKLINSEAKIVFATSEKMDKIDDNSTKLIITSPPYWDLKNYRTEGQIGYKEDYWEFINRLKKIWAECYRILDIDGTVWINVNSRIAKGKVYSLQKDITRSMEEVGFTLIEVLIWHKSSGIPVSDRRFKDNFEYVLIFCKNKKTFRLDPAKIFYDYKTSEKFMSCPNVWNINRFTGSIGKKFEHPAIYPDKLVERAIELCTNEGHLVVDPFLGSGTTALCAITLRRNFIGYELNKDFKKLIEYRIKKKVGDINYYSQNIKYV